MTNEQAYQMARPFPEFLAGVEAKRELWHALAARVLPFPEMVERVAAVPGSWRLLVIADDWCGDAVNTLPAVARLAEGAPNLEMRVVGRDEATELMDRHLTAGARAIPVILLLDEEGEERGWWGPRPRELQDWFQRMGRDMPIEERYKEIRRWYARDRGATAVSEVAGLVTAASLRDVEEVGGPPGPSPGTRIRSPGFPCRAGRIGAPTPGCAPRGFHHQFRRPSHAPIGEETTMLPAKRLIRTMALALVSFLFLSQPLQAQEKEPFSEARFQALQAEGALILVDVYADWCPTCAAQQEVLAAFQEKHPGVDLQVLRVDFDKQKEWVRHFGAPRQSTFILYRGQERVWFAVAETREEEVFKNILAAAGRG